MNKIAHSMTPKEYFTYACQDELAIKHFDNFIQEQETLEEDINYNAKRCELLEEQIYFAQELISNIEYALNNTTRLTEFKKQMKTLIDNSMFER